MTKDVLQPRRVADLTPENLQILIHDMGIDPGWYASADLYLWYQGMCREAGLTPVTRKAFGMALKALGYKSASRRVQGQVLRCWFISKRALRGGAAPGQTS